MKIVRGTDAVFVVGVRLEHGEGQARPTNLFWLPVL